MARAHSQADEDESACMARERNHGRIHSSVVANTNTNTVVGDIVHVKGSRRVRIRNHRYANHHHRLVRSDAHFQEK